ncbi:MAG: hypothetical protein WAW33_00230 [Minisyncoccia bacterium]
MEEFSKFPELSQDIKQEERETDQELLDFCGGDREAVKKVKEVRNKYAYKWWESSDPFEIAWGQLNEPILVMDIGKYMEALNTVLDRPVYNHELTSSNLEKLREEIRGNRPAPSLEEIIKMIPEEKRIIVELSEKDKGRKKTDIDKLKESSVLEDSLRKEKIENLSSLFSEAEEIVKNKGVEISEAREREKEYLIKIYDTLIALNKRYKENEDFWKNQLIWNPEGDLTEEEFNQLNLRRKQLSNAIGIVTASGEIRHNLNEI